MNSSDTGPLPASEYAISTPSAEAVRLSRWLFMAAPWGVGKSIRLSGWLGTWRDSGFGTRHPGLERDDVEPRVFRAGDEDVVP
jgi:hypothetical protein